MNGVKGFNYAGKFGVLDSQKSRRPARPSNKSMFQPFVIWLDKSYEEISEVFVKFEVL